MIKLDRNKLVALGNCFTTDAKVINDCVIRTNLFLRHF